MIAEVSNIPEFQGYKRGYGSSRERGRKSTVNCGFCGKVVPRQKTIPTYRGFRINDPTILREVERNNVHTMNQKAYACPSCARFRGIVEKKGQRQRRRA